MKVVYTNPETGEILSITGLTPAEAFTAFNRLITWAGFSVTIQREGDYPINRYVQIVPDPNTIDPPQ